MHESSPQPPPAPKITPHVRVRASQAAGMLLLALLPVLALAGIFDENHASVSASSGDFEFHVKYPTRLRYKTIDTIEIDVRNTSAREIELLRAAFDEPFISKFSNVVFTPDVKRAYVVELTGIKPGESRRISVELQGENYWRHTGTVALTTDGDTKSEPASVSLSTFVFP